MNVQELQLGDWVNIYIFPNDNPTAEDLLPAKITGVLYDGTIECSYNTDEDGVGYASRPADTCRPILLTPEILEKNNFRIYPQVAYWDDGTDRREIEIFNDHSATICNGTQSVSITINNVHELQHAIWLCGIKIEIVL